MEIGSVTCRHICEDASCKHLRVLLCALVVSVNIHLDVCGELFHRELSIFLEQVVGLGAHSGFSDGFDSVLDSYEEQEF